jgi:hypothetical protein
MATTDREEARHRATFEGIPIEKSGEIGLEAYAYGSVYVFALNLDACRRG